MPSANLKTSLQNPSKTILERIRLILKEEEEAHASLADAFMTVCDELEVEETTDASLVFIRAMQSFDTTNQRICHLTRVLEILSSNRTATVAQFEKDYKELRESPVDIDAAWLKELLKIGHT